eukprot:scaffold210707_cov24-Tisochrysis_lutea.AAC.1
MALAAAAILAAVAGLAPVTSVQAHSRGAVLSLAAGLLGGAPLLASGGYDGCVRLWAHDEGGKLQLQESLQAEQGATFSLAAASYDEGSCLLVAGSFSRRLSFWHLLAAPDGAERRIRSDHPLHSEFLHTGWVRSLTFASARHGARQPCRIHSIGCNRIVSWPLRAVRSEVALVSSLPLAPEAELAVYEDGDICERSHDILCLTHGSEEEALACGSIDGAIRVWSTREMISASELKQTPSAWWIGHPDERVTALAFHKGSLLSCGYDGWVRRWRNPAGSVVYPGECGGIAWELESEALPTLTAQMDGNDAKAVRVTSLVVAQCPNMSGEDRVHVGTSGGEVISLDANDLTELSRWSLPPAASAGQKPVRVTALSILPRRAHDEEFSARTTPVVAVGDSAGCVHILT